MAGSPVRDATVWDILLWGLRQRQRFAVVGTSMLPWLKPGDEILVNRGAYRSSPPAVGDVVVVQSPQQQGLLLVKRVRAARGDGACFVQGDNPDYSTDSREFGWIGPELVVGQVICRFF